MAELGANKSGHFLHLMPAFGAGLSWLLLGEGLHGFHVTGIGLIALGLCMKQSPDLSKTGRQCRDCNPL